MKKSKQRRPRRLCIERLSERITLDASGAQVAPFIPVCEPESPVIESRVSLVEPVRPLVIGPIISPDDFLIISSERQRESDLALPLILAGSDDSVQSGNAVSKSSLQNTASPQALRDAVDNRYLSLDNGHVSYDLLPQPAAIDFVLAVDEHGLLVNTENPRPTLADYEQMSTPPATDMRSSTDIKRPDSLTQNRNKLDPHHVRSEQDDEAAPSTSEPSASDSSTPDQKSLTSEDYFADAGKRQRVDWSVDVAASATRGELAIDADSNTVSEKSVNNPTSPQPVRKLTLVPEAGHCQTVWRQSSPRLGAEYPIDHPRCTGAVVVGIAIAALRVMGSKNEAAEPMRQLPPRKRCRHPFRD